MHTITLPQLGKGFAAATVMRWLTKPGDPVSTGDVMVELDAEFAIIQVQANQAGTIGEILAETRKTINVGDPLATLAPAGEKPMANTPPANTTNTENTTAGGNVTPIVMPKAGNSMEEGTIVAWKVAEGDQINVGDIIFEVETDKAVVEVEATDAGRLARIVATDGDCVEILMPVAYLADNDADVDAAIGAAPAAAAEAPAAPAPAAAAEGPKGDVTPIVMPKAGNSMEEGTIVAWKVAEGNQISVGDIIYEVETDKAVVEVEATDAGRLARIVAQDGDCVEILMPVAYLADDDADVDAYIAASGQTAGASETATATEAAPAAKTAPPAAAVKSDTGRVMASPAARKLAADRGVDLASIATGSGPRGRIVTTDIPAAGAARTPAKPAVITTGEVKRSKMSPMRKAIARNLLASKQNVPHFYIETTIDADAMMKFYKEEKAKYRLSVNDVVVKACGKIISMYPEFRSQVDGTDYVEYPTANIGIAVALDEGLVVPVLVGVEQMSLEQAATETRRIAENARGGKIEGMGQGVFTISNLGMLGVERFSAIINTPEAAILAVGAIREEVIVSGGMMRPGRKMTMTLSCDHRVIDGMVAAKFLSQLKDALEDPKSLA